MIKMLEERLKQAEISNQMQRMQKDEKGNSLLGDLDTCIKRVAEKRVGNAARFKKHNEPEKNKSVT